MAREEGGVTITELIPSLSFRLQSAWKAFKGEDVRFLGYGDPHVPDTEERVFHAFHQGYEAGFSEAKKDQSLDFDLPEGCHVAAMEFNSEEVE